jgi:hypothetical protein
VAAHVLNLELQLLLGALLGALRGALVSDAMHRQCHCHCRARVRSYLEGEMLEEVCGSVCPVRLGAAASIDPHADGRRLGPRRVLGSDLRHGVNCSRNSSARVRPTVKPLERVVDSVLEP